MQTPKVLLALIVVFIINFANACVSFDGTYNIGTSKIGGTMTDNGKKTCMFSGKVAKDKKYLHASCIFKMKLLQTLAVVSLFTVSYACLKFDGKYNWDTRVVSGTIIDNGKQICTFGGRFEQQHHFGTCIPGFSAFIDESFNWGSYSNRGNEGTFTVRKETGPGLNNHEFFILGDAFGC
ncbi:hypothetical protein VE03_04186 [Pseudogymnoascus sp. 23342-1-I1]|nr:hypothetical protein VE03_04186 [Pseudogymnoascus sp. 23342-1-I1]